MQMRMTLLTLTLITFLPSDSFSVNKSKTFHTTKAVNSNKKITCVCQDQHGDNVVTIENFPGTSSNCSNLAGQGTSSVLITTPQEGTTSCSNTDISANPFSCTYSFKRVHISSCSSH